MMNRFKYLLFWAMVLSCGNPSKVDQLHKDLMVIHDEIMPITHVKLKKIERSIQSNSEIDSLVKSDILNRIDQVQSDMDHWMKTYAKPSDSQSDDLTISYYEKQFSILEKMRKDTYNALEDAQNIIQ